VGGGGVGRGGNAEGPGVGVSGKDAQGKSSVALVVMEHGIGPFQTSCPPAHPPARLQAETSVRLLRWCQQRDVPLDRNMWHRWAGLGFEGVWLPVGPVVAAASSYLILLHPAPLCLCLCLLPHSTRLTDPPWLHCPCSVMDVCAKVGQPAVVEQLMQARQGEYVHGRHNAGKAGGYMHGRHNAGKAGGPELRGRRDCRRLPTRWLHWQLGRPVPPFALL